MTDECRAPGGEALAVPADVSVEREVDDLATEAVKEYGRIDVWVGNAGVFAYGAFEELPSEVFRQVVETNLMGQVHGARAALSQFRRQGGGALVMVGSLYSRVGSPAISPYVTSKFGLLGFAETLRQELRGTGITLRVILPGRSTLRSISGLRTSAVGTSVRSRRSRHLRASRARSCGRLDVGDS